MNPVVIIFAPVIILGLPVFFISKYFERKMNPRGGFKAFFWWLIAVLAVSFAWYFVCMFTFFKFFSLRS